MTIHDNHLSITVAALELFNWYKSRYSREGLVHLGIEYEAFLPGGQRRAMAFRLSIHETASDADLTESLLLAFGPVPRFGEWRVGFASKATLIEETAPARAGSMEY